MSEIVVLVDEKDHPIGYEEKIKAHSDGGKLHRACSIFIYNSRSQMLLQLRPNAKHHFQSLWSNGCCSHPLKGEELEKAAQRKLKQEFGFDTELKEAASFLYTAKDPRSGLTEHEFSRLSDEEVQTLKTGALPGPSAQRMIENVVGVLPIPLGIAVNFLVNDKDYLIPMAIEEPSVVAAASHAAKMARAKGGFKTSSTEPIMIGQVQLVKCPSPRDAEKAILSSKQEILNKANQQDPTLVSKGGGAKDLRVRILPSLTGTMVISELFVDCRDAMGANVVNTMAEAVAPVLEKLSGGIANLRIISNLADRRIAKATAHFSKDDLGGEEVVDRIVQAYAFAAADPYRCATHNKGVMNGVTAVCLATGNDTRAIEAGAKA